MNRRNKAAEPATVPTALRLAELGAQLWRKDGPRVVTYGAVALEANSTKSLVSHHYRTHDSLLLASAKLLATRIINQILGIKAALDAAPLQLLRTEDALAILIDALLTSDERSATCILEIAALAMRDGTYRPLFDQILQTCDLVIAAPEAGTAALFKLILLGELLRHSALPRSPVGPIGLRARLLWLRSPPREHRLLIDGLIRLAQERSQPTPKPFVTPNPAHNDRRAQIVDAARRLLARGEHPTHRSIAIEANVPVAATTYYFQSLTEILEAVYESILGRARERANALSQRQDRNETTALLELIAAMASRYVTHEADATAAHLHLALIAARTPALQTWALQAHEAELQSVDLLLANSSRNSAHAILSFLSGWVLMRLQHEQAVGPPPRTM